MKRILSLLAFSIVLTSCSGEDTTVVEPVQKNDKNLTCEEILFEMNDSEYYIKQAKEKKSLGVKSIVMPLGYIDTYMTADEAISAATQRIEYLKRIYDIRGCAAQQETLEFQRKMQSNMQKQVQQQQMPASQNLYYNPYNTQQGY